MFMQLLELMNVYGRHPQAMVLLSAVRTVLGWAVSVNVLILSSSGNGLLRFSVYRTRQTRF